PSYVLYLGYALDYGEGISRRPPAPLERIAEPVTRSFPGATTRWFDGVGQVATSCCSVSSKVFALVSSALTLLWVLGFLLRFFYSLVCAGLCVALWWRVVFGSGV
ncbi:unnamed protein product, partial [Brassica rapa subsp. trilocularis]